MYISKSRVVGVGGVDTGLGLFTYKQIQNQMYVCSYTSTASLKMSPQSGEYVMPLKVGGQLISVNRKENDYEIGLGIYANDGTSPFSLAPEKFSRLVSTRVNCKFDKRDNEVWIKTTREIGPNEELLVSYSPDLIYRKTLFSPNQLKKIKEALVNCGPTIEDAEKVFSKLVI